MQHLNKVWIEGLCLMWFWEAPRAQKMANGQLPIGSIVKRGGLVMDLEHRVSIWCGNMFSTRQFLPVCYFSIPPSTSSTSIAPASSTCDWIEKFCSASPDILCDHIDNNRIVSGDIRKSGEISCWQTVWVVELDVLRMEKESDPYSIMQGMSQFMACLGAPYFPTTCLDSYHIGEAIFPYSWYETWIFVICKVRWHFQDKILKTQISKYCYNYWTEQHSWGVN